MSTTNDQTIAAYNSFAQDYIATTPTLDALSGIWAEWIDENLATLSARASILELGSASGRDAAYIEGKGYKVERTDATQSFVDYLKSQGHEARLLNVVSDPLPTAIDMIFANAVLLHLTPEELVKIFGKIAQALSPNGRLVFSVKQGTGEEIEDNRFGAARYFHYWQPEELKTMLNSAGFTTVSWKTNPDNRPGKPSWLLISAVKGGKS